MATLESEAGMKPAIVTRVWSRIYPQAAIGSDGHKSLHTMSRCDCQRCRLSATLLGLTGVVGFVALCGLLLMASRALGILFRGM